MICGAIAVRLINQPSLLQPCFRFASILLIRPGGIGDAVHLLPTIQFLKKHLPETSIDVIVERRNAAVFALSQEVRTIFRYDIPGEFLSVFNSKYDVVIDTEQWHRLSAVVARMINAGMRIGFDTNERRRMFNFPVSYSHSDYEADNFLRLLEPLGICENKRAVSPWLTIPIKDAAHADNLLRPLSGGGFVTIFPGASIPERRWGAARFRSVVESLAANGIQSVVLGGPEDVAAGDEVVRGGTGLNLAGRTSLPVTAAIIDRCSVLVSGDSGLLHLGVGLGKPTVSLFGPGIAAKWAPEGENHVVINNHLPCSPCTRFGYTPPCKIHAQCISEISPEEVFSAALMLHNRKTP